jgi:hypothetical protein
MVLLLVTRYIPACLGSGACTLTADHAASFADGKGILVSMEAFGLRCLLFSLPGQLSAAHLCSH